MPLTPDEFKELKRLLYERYSLQRLLGIGNRDDPAAQIMVAIMRAVAIIFLAACAIWLGFAIWNGAIDIFFLLCCVLIGLLIAFLLTREIRLGGFIFYVGDIFMVFLGGDFWLRHDPDNLRRHLAMCEARIAELARKNST